MHFYRNVVREYHPPRYAKFKVGDHVERIGVLVPEYMRSGVSTRVTPNDEGQDLFNEYEVNFGNQVVAILYESQLRLATKANP